METIFTGDGDNKIYADSGGSNITVGAGQNIIYANLRRRHRQSRRRQ